MSGRRLRVLHVVQNLNYGGMERLIADIVLRSDPARFDMHVLALQYLGRFAEGLEAAGTVHLSPPMSRLSLLRPRQLAGVIRGIEPAVVHSHSGVWYKTSLAARMAGVGAVLHTDHGRPTEIPWLVRRLDRRAALRCDAVVAVSEELAERLRGDLVRDPDRLRVIPNGVDTEVHRPRPDHPGIAAELGIEPNRAVIGSIGRLEAVKGYDVMIRAFALLRGREPLQESVAMPALVIAGDGAEQPALEELARDLGVQDDVIFLGWRDDVEALHATFDIFTMSSHSEGTSVSLLEAMSAGICPVVTAVGGTPAVLGPTLAHRLVPPGRPDLLADAWINALTAAETTEEDAARARERVLEAFDARAMVEAYGQLYEELATGG